MKKHSKPAAVEDVRSRVPIQLPPRPVIDEQEEARQIAHWAKKAKELPAVRRELVDRVKAQLSAGTYETPEKLDVAIVRLMQDLADA